MSNKFFRSAAILALILGILGIGLALSEIAPSRQEQICPSQR